MINAEKFKDELRIIIDSNKLNDCAFRKNNKTFCECSDTFCENCIFDNRKGCQYGRIKWMLSEYKEGIVLSKLEYALLKYIFNRTKYRYIVRSKLGEVFVYENEPIKNGDDWSVLLNGGGFTTIVFLSELFKFIKWSDLTAISIKDVLADCNVIDDNY
mgnify:FL=1|jgi:hypothetical protein